MKKTAATLFLIGAFLIFWMILLKAEICGAVVVEIDIPLKAQEHSNWCWAGSSQAILDYYGALPSQCTIANWAFGRSDCCGNSTFNWSHLCNVGNSMYSASGSLQDILTHWGVNSDGRYYALTFPTVVSEINAHRPFVMRYLWTSGGGHFLVGYGYDQSTSQINYMDPWPGNGYTAALYSWAVSASDHTWTHTLQVTTNPRPDLVVTSVDGPSSGTPGQTVSVSFSVRNQGNGPTNFSPSGGGSVENGVYLSTNTTIATSDRRICQWFDSEIEAGRTENYTLNCTIPGDLAPGTYYWGVIADVGLAIAESNDSNNTGYDPNPITITQSVIIYVKRDGVCAGRMPCYLSIQAAINASGPVADIRITDEVYSENIIINPSSDKLITLKGGWNSNFTAKTSVTTIEGSLTISDGENIAENILVKRGL